jgi:hypothetical protein
LLSYHKIEDKQAAPSDEESQNKHCSSFFNEEEHQDPNNTMENSPNYNVNIMISSPSEGDAWWQVPYLSSNSNAFPSAPETRLYNASNNSYYGMGQRQQQQNQLYQRETLLDIAPSASQDSSSTYDDGTHVDFIGAQIGYNDGGARKTREPLRDITKACNKRRCRGGDH